MELLRAERCHFLFLLRGDLSLLIVRPASSLVVGFRYSTVRQSRHRFSIPSVAALFDPSIPIEAGNF